MRRTDADACRGRPGSPDEGTLEGQLRQKCWQKYQNGTLHVADMPLLPWLEARRLARSVTQATFGRPGDPATVTETWRDVEAMLDVATTVRSGVVSVASRASVIASGWYRWAWVRATGTTLNDARRTAGDVFPEEGATE